MPPKRTPVKKIPEPTDRETRSSTSTPAKVTMAEDTPATFTLADFMAYVQAENQKQEQIRREEREDRKEELRQQKRQYEQQIELLKAQLERQNSASSERARAPTTKAPLFDLENDKENFAIWAHKWEVHIKGQGLHLIRNEEERRNRELMELHAALSDKTHKCLAHQNFSKTQMSDADFLVRALEAHTKEGLNPTVEHINLSSIAKHRH